MLFSSLNLFARLKAKTRRVTTAVIAVFMVQIIAAGFCVTTASAAHMPTEMTHVMATSHCAEMNMNSEMMVSQNSEQSGHSCAHCDLPDVSIHLDKELSALDFVQAVDVFIAWVPATHVLLVTDFQNLSPPLRTALFSFDLNQRIRV